MIRDPYPPELLSPEGEDALPLAPLMQVGETRNPSIDDLAVAIHRLAAAIERSGAPQAPALAVLPPIQAAAKEWVCPIHGGRKVVPAGISKKTGNAYEAFVACPTAGCDQRPPR